MMDVADVLESYLGPPERGGKGNLAYRCPFHGGGHETKPSFFVQSDTGLAFCHACNQGWTFPKLLMQLGAPSLVVTAASAILREASRPRVAVKGYTGLDNVHLLPEVLTSITMQCPVDLLNDGFYESTLLDNEVGYDIHNECVLYHLRDHLGRLIAVDGRWATGYYVYTKKQLANFASPDILGGYKTPEKSNFLWNMHRVYPSLWLRPGPVIVVEGFKACMWVQQCGFPNVVALMGSYLSDQQALLLERVASEVTMFLDLDKAGRKGTYRALSHLKSRLLVKRVIYPRGSVELGDKLQPDSLTPDEVQTAIATAMPSYRSEL
jgi:hypothetical protein